MQKCIQLTQHQTKLLQLELPRFFHPEAEEDRAQLGADTLVALFGLVFSTISNILQFFKSYNSVKLKFLIKFIKLKYLLL